MLWNNPGGCFNPEQPNMEMNQNQMPNNMGPVYETPIERVVERNICHEVRHVCPINTRIINNHIIRHTYCPKYTCCEQNVVTNLDQGSCCNFM